jgi:hypothetical protein
MIITLTSKVPREVSDEEIVKAMRVETAIINHCIANRYGFMDVERGRLLDDVEGGARDRLAILQEILSS